MNSMLAPSGPPTAPHGGPPPPSTAGHKWRRIWRRTARAYRTLSPYGRPYRLALLRGLLATLGVVAARLAFPWPMRAVMEAALHQGHRGGALLSLLPARADPVTWLVIAFVAIILCWAVSEHLQRLTFARFAGAVARDTRTAALAAIGRGAGKGHAADLVASAQTDSTRLKSGLRGLLINATRNGLFFFAATAIIAVIDLEIGLVFLAGGLASLAVALIGASHVSKISRRLRAKEPGVTATIELFSQDTDDGLSDPGPVGTLPSAKLVRAEGRTTMAIHVVLAASTSAILILALHASQAGRLRPGDIFTILVYTLFMHNKTVSAGRRTVRIGSLLTSAERLAALIAPRAKPTPTPRDSATAKPAFPWLPAPASDADDAYEITPSRPTPNTEKFPPGPAPTSWPPRSA
ncbi:MAG: hypothetical protein ACR2KV_00970 [Solirubrobacteraceae bacterium]